MCNRHGSNWVAGLLLAALAGGYLIAAPAGPELPGHLFVEGLDGAPVIAVNPLDRSEWAVWAYRNGSEFDLALTFRNEGDFWSSPIFIGLDDGIDQVDPALAIDSHGGLYLLFAERPTGRVRLGILPSGAESFIGPFTVSEAGQHAGSPALEIYGEHVVIAYHAADGTTIRRYPVLTPDMAFVKGIQEGPDAIDPLGLTPTDSEATGDQSEDPGTGLFRSNRGTSGKSREFGPSQKGRDSY